MAARSKKKPAGATKEKASEVADTLNAADTCLLWGRAGGHCSNPGCRSPISKFQRSTLVGNSGERAHIVGRRKGGPRGDQDRSAVLAAALSNHILLCPICHKMVDDNPAAFPELLLLDWKSSHEALVASVLRTALVAKRTVALHVRAHFGPGARMIAAEPRAMLQATLQTGRMFDELGGCYIIEADQFRRDHEEGYWNSAPDGLLSEANQWVGKRGGFAKLEHLTVFASGPIPLLVALGRLIGDTRPVDVRNFDRDSSSWDWPDPAAEPPRLLVTQTDPSCAKEVRLVIDLSGRTDRDAQAQALGGRLMPEVCVTVDEPSTSLVRGPRLLPELRKAFQHALELAKNKVGDDGIIHVFAAMPLSAAVAFGQAQLPKALPTMHIYDNNSAAGGWRRAISFERDLAK